MTRRGNPRHGARSGKNAATGVWPALAALLPALAVLTLAGPVRADDVGASTERTKGARTVIGALDSTACAAAAAQGLFDADSLAACTRALETERLNRANRIATLTNRGAMNLRARNGDAALADFDAVIALAPRHAEAHLNRGAALVMVRKPGPAVAAITSALSYGVSVPHKAYFNRAAAREALGDIRGAYEDYNTALTIQPDWGAAEAELARFARGRRERLAAQISEASATTP